MSDTPVIPSVQDGARLKAFLIDSGYTTEGLMQVLNKLEKPPLPQYRTLPLLLELTREPTPLNQLIRWFTIGEPCPVAHAQALLPDWFLTLSLQYRLLVRETDDYRPTTLLVWFDSLLLACDLYQKLVSDNPYDYVQSTSPSTKYLFQSTFRHPVDSFLDVGCGCGVHALFAARHARQVTAIDLNPRAVAYTRFNAVLNGIDNIECLVGDRFDPVKGRRFDLIVSNPPFILTPSKRFHFSDNEFELDGFCRQLVRAAPDYLHEGGYFQMIFEWAQLKDEPWERRLKAWFDDSGCDAWVLLRYINPPAWYAYGRLREVQFGDEAADRDTYNEWMEYFRALGLEKIQGGHLIMRKRDNGHNWIRYDEFPDHLVDRFDETLRRGIAAQDFLAAHAEDASLLRTTPRLAEDVSLRSTAHHQDGRWHTSVSTLHGTMILGDPFGVEPGISDFLAALDGKTTLDDLTAALAREAGVPLEVVHRECLDLVRLMLQRGVVLPA